MSLVRNPEPSRYGPETKLSNVLRRKIRAIGFLLIRSNKILEASAAVAKILEISPPPREPLPRLELRDVSPTVS